MQSLSFLLGPNLLLASQTATILKFYVVFLFGSVVWCRSSGSWFFFLFFLLICLAAARHLFIYFLEQGCAFFLSPLHFLSSFLPSALFTSASQFKQDNPSSLTAQECLFIPSSRNHRLSLGNSFNPFFFLFALFTAH